jgi:hypothetical protein
MPNYRRAFAPGGCWFFTVNLLDRRRRLLTDNIDALRAATRRAQTRHPFTIDAMRTASASVFEMERRNALRLLRPTGCRIGSFPPIRSNASAVFRR